MPTTWNRSLKIDYWNAISKDFYFPLHTIHHMCMGRARAREREKLKDSRASRDSKVTGRVSFPFKFCCETYNNGSMSEHWKWALQNSSTVCVISLELKPTSDRRRRHIMSRCPYQIGSIARSPPSYGASQCSQCVSLHSILPNEWLRRTTNSSFCLY